MKRPLILSILTLLLSAFTASGQDFTVGGVCYFYTDDTHTALEVSGHTDDLPAEVVIPPTHEGLPVTSIGDWAFSSCTDLTLVTIPESVTYIGDGAFGFCYGLLSVTIPESVTSIDDCAFLDCSSLTSVTIPESVTSIGVWAFYNCSGLTSVTIPESVTSIGEEAFAYLPNLQVVHVSSSTPYSISSDVFEETPIENCTLYVPKGAREAYAAAAVWSEFGNFVEVEDIDPTEVLDEVVGHATTLEGWEDTPNIAPDADLNIDILKDNKIRINAWAGVESYDVIIAYDEDFNITSVTPVYNGEEGTTYTSGWAYLYTGNGNEYFAVYIAEGYGMAYSQYGEGLVWYQGYMNGDSDDFRYYSVEWPIKAEIDNFAALSDVPENTPFIVGMETTIAEYKDGCALLYDGSSYFLAVFDQELNQGDVIAAGWMGLTYTGKLYLLEDVTVAGEGVAPTPTKVDKDNFNESITNYNYVTIAGVEIPEGLTSDEMTDLTTDWGEEFIGMDFFATFGSVEGGKTYDVTGFWMDIAPLFSDEANNSAMFAFIPLTYGDNTSYDFTADGQDFTVGGVCYSYIDDTHTELKVSSYTADLPTEVVIPSSVEGLPVISIGYEAFSYCSGLTSVTIPESVTSIGEFAFCECSALTLATIPESVTYIGGYAFEGCNGLTSVTIPESVTYIGDGAFGFCYSLPSVTIPESVTYIGFEAFEGCNGLTSVTIPESVTYISEAAFKGCSGLSAFYGKYASDDNRCIVKDGSLIGFASVGLTEYTIPESVTYIGRYAFMDCSGLTSVTIPESVTSIGLGAFQSCGLTSVTIPESVTSIGDVAFNACSLTSVTIPESVTYIGDGAFYACGIKAQHTGLTLTLPPSAEIGMRTFGNLQNLQEVYATGNTPYSLPSNAFESTPIENCTLYVPKGSREAYAAAEVWRDFGNIVEVESAEPYSLVIAETEVVAEQLALIPVSLVNEGGVKGLQCDIHLPAGVEMATDDYGDAYIERSDRTSIHDFGINYTNGCWRIVCTNMRNIEIPAGDGVLFYIPVIAEDNPSDLTLSIDNIYLSLTGDVLQPVAPTEGTLHILPAFITGDADGDRAVTVADFTYAVSYILGHEVEGFNFRAADINGDGQVLISDATAILSLVLESGQGGGAASSLPAKAPMATLPILHLSDIQADFDGTATASFSIDGASSYAAAQFDLLLPQGMTVLDVRVADDQRHQALYSNHDGRARVVVFSADNSPFRGDRVLDITFGIDASADGAVAIADGLVVEVATDGIRKYAATGADASVSGIAVATAALRIAVESRTLLITAPEAADIVLTGANGVSRRISLHPGLNRIPLPAPGVYLVGNRKVIAY